MWPRLRSATCLGRPLGDAVLVPSAASLGGGRFFAPCGCDPTMCDMPCCAAGETSLFALECLEVGRDDRGYRLRTCAEWHAHTLAGGPFARRYWRSPSGHAPLAVPPVRIRVDWRVPLAAAATADGGPSTQATLCPQHPRACRAASVSHPLLPALLASAVVPAASRWQEDAPAVTLRPIRRQQRQQRRRRKWWPRHRNVHPGVASTLPQAQRRAKRGDSAASAEARWRSSSSPRPPPKCALPQQHGSSASVQGGSGVPTFIVCSTPLRNLFSTFVRMCIGKAVPASISP